MGLIQNDRGVLVLKKSQGRTDAPAVWELPTGKIKFGEQPEEAMGRAIEEYLTVNSADSIELADVVTFVALQGSSQLSNLYIVYNITLKNDAKILPRERYTAYKFANEAVLASMRLDEASLSVLEIENRTGAKPDYKDVANSATVFVDGCSRGNPGPAGIGYHIIGENGIVLSHGGEFIGFATSRVAEYYSLRAGCEEALRLGLKTVRFVSDNLMMINQMNGIYKIKNRDLLPIYDDIQELIKKFDACAFVHVGREQNTLADREANLAVDRHFGIENR